MHSLLVRKNFCIHFPFSFAVVDEYIICMKTIFTGFLAQLIQDKPYDVCVECGNWAASEVIQNSGCIFNRSDSFCASSTS